MCRPDLTKELSSQTFLQYYYLKEELLAFCKQEGLSTAGNKIQLTKRIAFYLDTGKEQKETLVHRRKIEKVTKDMKIIENISYSEELRSFFQQEIGPSFHFHVPFQRWLKANVGKTYGEAILAYQELKKNPQKTKIDKQFEYNTYIRDFFQDNKGRTIQDAIACWNYKKKQKGTHRYERKDLIVLEKTSIDKE